MKILPETYTPSEIEDKLYQRWMDRGYFHAEVDEKKKASYIVTSLPNITGQLHMGHALDNTVQDTLTRFRRTQGYSALWQPDTDHAAIATEVKIIEKPKKEGRDKGELGREKFLEECWARRDEHDNRIISQLKKLDFSVDRDRERFTMDESCPETTKEVFLRLYEKDYIYRGSHIINWHPVCQTTISDMEVEHVDKDGFFWRIKYPIVGEDGVFVEIATTRPETLLGDIAVAVNPDDACYTALVGKMLKPPLTDHEIPVIADSYVDPEFGAGCVEITPAHDPNNFEVGKRHNLLETTILNDDAMIRYPGSPYDGMDRHEARKAMVKDLEAVGLLVKVVPHSHAVGVHDRCKTVIEPMIKSQWLVKMEEMAKPAIAALKSGELKFALESYGKIYSNWSEGIHDWCISHQLWWGHRTLAYHCDKCGEVIVACEMPHTCPYCDGHNFRQKEDTLGTWFSSALWPFSTLGWPKDTPEYHYFYPADVLVTGYDIIFFWVIRMVFPGIEQTGKLSFHTVLIHGLVRDAEGRKMSKLLGSGIDLPEVIDRYGVDALCLTLMTDNAPGNDMRFYRERAETARNFANKIWNMAHFIEMNLGETMSVEPAASALLPQDRWVLHQLSRLTKEVTENLERFEFGIALQKVYDFIWEEFCDWYIEMVKLRLWSKKDLTREVTPRMLREVLSRVLKLLHPFMPFITEEVLPSLNEGDSIMVPPWPIEGTRFMFPEDAAGVEHVKDAVREIRYIRTSMNVVPGQQAEVFMVSEDEAMFDSFHRAEDFSRVFGRASEVELQKDKAGIREDAVSAVISGTMIYIPFADLVDVEKEKKRLAREGARLESEIARADGMLRNEKLLVKASADKVAVEQKKWKKHEEMLEKVREQRKMLGA